MQTIVCLHFHRSTPASFFERDKKKLAAEDLTAMNAKNHPGWF